MSMEDAGVAEMSRLRSVIMEMPSPDNLAALLDDRADEMGDSVLANFFHDETTLTYSGLSEDSRRMADSLMGLGVRKGTHVGISMENCRQFVIAWFALARIGAVMVPINFRYNPHEMELALVDSDAQFLFVDKVAEPTLRKIDPLPSLLREGGIIVLDPVRSPDDQSFDDLVQAGSVDFVAPEPVHRSDVLAIQFTSGSTGRPKGCMLTHDYWLTVACVAGTQRSTGTVPPVRNILVTYPLFYMQAQIEFLMALQNRGTAFVARSPSRRNFMDWVRRYRIHYTAMNPMVYHGLPVRPDDGDNDLRYIAAYYHRGDVLRTLQDRFQAVGRDSFGMTEAGSVANVPVAATHMLDAGTCGLPSAFREVRIMDPEGNEVPTGEPGELCISGKGLFLGYYKRPRENRDSFHHWRWFRTGDLARVDKNGYVFIIGRIKEMIKRSGENIAAMEVEQVLRECPGVREVAVVAVPDPARMEEVHAVVSLKDGFSLDDLPPETLHGHCSAMLSDFKVPRYFSYVDRFPRTGSQKIDKNELVKNSTELNCRTYDYVMAQWLNLVGVS